MSKYFLILLFLVGCGEDSPTVDTLCDEPTTTLEYVNQFCDSHFGVKEWTGLTSGRVSIECLDGTYALIENFRLP